MGRKKILSFIAILYFCIFLTGCGGKQQTVNDGTIDEKATETTEGSNIEDMDQIPDQEIELDE